MQRSVISMEPETEGAAGMLSSVAHGSDIQTQEQGL